MIASSRVPVTVSLCLCFAAVTVGCGPSEEELAQGKARADLLSQQSALVAKFDGSALCQDGVEAIKAWSEANRDAIAASDTFWNNLSESTKDKLYAEFPAYSQGNKDRAIMLIRCGSDRDLWDGSP
ncbi:MAG: hypothetical protein R3B72_50590 [Polyangiaceae bacterium]